MRITSFAGLECFAAQWEPVCRSITDNSVQIARTPLAKRAPSVLPSLWAAAVATREPENRVKNRVYYSARWSAPGGGIHSVGQLDQSRRGSGMFRVSRPNQVKANL
ncbi:hypothetical protein AAFF_G00060540 [Aldrovandia affinis]|uniref:Uncharacterized protein n=1 Tax=Aldrovandia affinis TaxID=143900 RepID=A0AAD7WDX8_9TELE|nr:hypothetical protein AAFF_G00060540 [Aldrovandia affinis]